MRTKNPCSTISYNSQEFLKSTLDDFLSEHLIQFYMFIKHDAEEDEKKDHIHVYIEPNRLIDTMVLQERLREINKDDLNKPFGCQPFRCSISDEWIPYDIHDKGYLALKGEIRSFFYTKDDIIRSDDDYFEDLFHKAFHASKWARDAAVITKLTESSRPSTELIDKGYIPWNMASQLNAYYCMKYGYGTKIDRNGRSNHEED